MIRKWSYINNQFTTSHSHKNLNITETFNLPLRFKFKIFRKTTRFKKFNLSYTRFIRHLPALKKRRVNWKLYFIISSGWVKPFLKSKQINSFIQNKKMYIYSLNYPSILLLSKKPNYVKNLIGIGVIGLNYSVLSHNLLNKISLNLSRIPKTTLLKHSLQFYSLRCSEKLLNLGLPTNNLVLSSNKYLLSKPLLTYTPVCLKHYTTHFSTINIATSLRKLHTLFVLRYINI
jgi:hypothetical protein